MSYPRNCIVPPHMLESIGQNGTVTQQAVARVSMQASDDTRSARATAPPQAVLAAQAGVKERIVYDGQTGDALPGREARREGEAPTSDAAVNEAYDGSGDTYDLYQQAYSRDSIDGINMRLDSTVHHRQGYDNAFWNGRQMVYGDGDEDQPEVDRLFNRFTRSLDVIGHELTHGVVQFTAGLVYRNQSGALNEHFADVFGSLVKQWKLGQQANDADWIIGAGLFTANVQGSGIRSMKAPGTAYNDPVLGRDPQPGHMNDFNNTTSDNGGVHINSGIPNHAFYRAAIELGGKAWERTGRIWYQTLTGGRLGNEASFDEAAGLTHTVAGGLFGAGSVEQQAVRTGWAAVGINVGSSEPAPAPEPRAPEPPSPAPNGGRGCLVSLLTLGLYH